jgi:hypothetical protein
MEFFKHHQSGGDSVVGKEDLDPINITEIRPSEVQTYFASNFELSPTKYAIIYEHRRRGRNFSTQPELFQQTHGYKEYAFGQIKVFGNDISLPQLIGTKPWEN